MIRRIAVVGPESTGKTTLVEHLASWLRARGVAVEVVAEQGRLLARRLPPGHRWSNREQLATSLLHRAAETAARVVLAATTTDGVVLADGTAATPLVWHLCAVQDRPDYDAGTPAATEELVAAVAEAEYDLVLLTAPDIEWEPDGIREDPHGRDRAFQRYRWLFPDAVVIRGPDRGQQAEEVVSALLRMPSERP